MRVRKAAPTELPAEVLDRVLDKGIVAGAAVRRGDAPIELAGSAYRIVIESEDYIGASSRRPIHAA